MDERDIKEYNKIIRSMLQHEDNIRNQRTTWFLVIQGLLANAIIMIYIEKDLNCQMEIISLLLFLASIVSFSFLYVAKKSARASNYGEEYWKDILDREKKNNEDYPPICLLAKEKYVDKKLIMNYLDYFQPCFFLPLVFSLIEPILLVLLNI